MRFRLLAPLGLLLLLVMLLAPGLCEAQPFSVYVVEFANPGGARGEEWLGPFIADSIENNLKCLPEVKLVHGKRPGNAAGGSDLSGPDALRSRLCAMAGAEGARFVVGGDFRSDGEKLSVEVYLLQAEGVKQVGGASFITSEQDLYSRLDDLSVSLARAMGLEYSDDQFARMRVIPTTSIEAMSFYGRALMTTPTSKEHADLLLRATYEDPTYTDALSKLGLYYYETGRLAKAQEAFETLLKRQADYSYAYYNLGLVYRSRKYYSRAVEAYRNALRTEPEDSDIWNNLGVTYCLMDMREDGMDAFRRAIELNPDDATARNNLSALEAMGTERPAGARTAAAVNKLKEHIESGAALYATGDYWRAIKEFDKALDIQPDNFKANNNIALAYLKIGELEKAKEHFDRALKADPTALDVSENLARLESAPEPSEAACQADASSETLDESHALSAAGKVYLSRRSYEQAANAFSRALASFPDDVEALNGLGTAYFALEKFEKAREQFQKALSLEPENETAKKKLKDVESVLAVLEKEPDGEEPFRLSTPPQIEARVRLIQANELCEAGNYEEAVGEYLRALDLAPTSVETLNNLGSAYFALQRYKEAKAVLEKASRLDPDNELIQQNLDVLASVDRAEKPTEMKRLEAPPESPTAEVTKEATPKPPPSSDASVKAESSTDTAAPKEPPSASAAQEESAQTSEDVPETPSESALRQLSLGASKEVRGDFEGALEHYREAVRLEPDNPNAQHYLGNIYFRLGAFESAIECYKAALKIDPQLATAHNNIGSAYYRLGRKHEARAAWKRALEVDPTLESARKNLEKFADDHAAPTDVPSE